MSLQPMGWVRGPGGVIGRPGRAQGLHRFLSPMRKFPNVWVTNRDEIARFRVKTFGKRKE